MLHVDRIADLRTACDAALCRGPAGRARADDGVPARRPPLVDAGSRGGDRLRGRDDLRQPAPVRRRTRTSTGTRAISPVTSTPARPRASTACSRPSVAEMYPRPPRHDRARRPPHRRPVRCGPPDAFRRRHDGGRQALRDHRAVPRVLRAQGRAAARGRHAAWPTDLDLPGRGRRAARSCASPTVSRCRAATRTSAPSEREAARVLSHALRRAVDAIVGGERDATRSSRTRRARRSGAEPRVELEYAEVRDAHELTPMADARAGRCWSRSPLASVRPG